MLRKPFYDDRSHSKTRNCHATEVAPTDLTTGEVEDDSICSWM